MSDMPFREPDRWCAAVPGLQKLWSASSLRLLMECPRKYWYRYVRGIATDEPKEHLEFGKFLHAGLQEYAVRRVAGAEHDLALRHALVAAMMMAGQDVPMLKCRCGAEHEGPPPEDKRCPRCREEWSWGPGAPIMFVRWIPWDSDNKKKNRPGLFRALVWTLDTFKDSNILPYAWSDGTAAVEDRFIVELPKDTPDGDRYLLQGYTDRFGQLGADGRIIPIETKTTGSTLGRGFFGRYEFDIQIDTYSLVLRMMAAPELVQDGVAVEGVQVGQEFSRARRQIIAPPPDQLDEFRETVLWWLGEAERYAREGFWPMNRANCNNFRKEDAEEAVGVGGERYGGCPYRGICTKARSVREVYMRGAG